jgi:hypothetical protein
MPGDVFSVTCTFTLSFTAVVKSIPSRRNGKQQKSSQWELWTKFKLQPDQHKKINSMFAWADLAGWKYCWLVFWEKNTAGWLTDLVDNFKRTGWKPMYFCYCIIRSYRNIELLVLYSFWTWIKYTRNPETTLALWKGTCTSWILFFIWMEATKVENRANSDAKSG